MRRYGGLPAPGGAGGNAGTQQVHGAEMTLKAKLEQALEATPVDNTRRRDTLRAAVNAGPSDADMEAALRRLIEAREQRAASLVSSGQPDLAKAEREEIAVLSELLERPGAPAGGATRSGVGRLKLSRVQLIYGGIAVLALAAVVFFLLRPSGESTGTTSAADAKITVFKDDRTLGNPNAPVTLLEYASPSCPHCAQFALDEMPSIKKDLIDTGKVFYIFRVFPIHPPDGAVEGIARCLPPGRYFPYMERMYRALSQWYSADTKDVRGAIEQLASEQGLSREQADRCMADQRVLDRTNEVAQDAAGRYQVDRTPFFIVNGAVVNIPPGQEAGSVLRVRINSLLGADE